MSTRPRYTALRSADFRALWIGMFVSNVGTWMQNVAQGWLIYRMTGHDPVSLGLLGLSFAVPMTVLPPLGGAVADRVDRVTLLFVTQTAALVVSLVLAWLAWTDALRVWHMLAASFTGAVLLAFDNPARHSLAAELVPREDLPNALSLNAATFTGAALVGPAIAGALLVPLGAAALFVLNAVSFLAVIAALVRLRRRVTAPRPRSSWSDALLGGVRYAWRERDVRALLITSAAAAMLGRSYQQLLPIFAADVWHAGPGAYGALLAASGAGAIVGAFALSSMRAGPAPERLMWAGGVALGGGLIVFAAMPSLAAGVTVLVVVGIASTVLTTMIATQIQLKVPGPLRGRVTGLYTITLIGLPALGSLGAAALASWMKRTGAGAGAPGAVMAGGATLLVVLAVVWRAGKGSRLAPPSAVSAAVEAQAHRGDAR